MGSGWSDKFNMIPFIGEASDTEETGEEGRDRQDAVGDARTDLQLHREPIRRCVTRSTLHGKACIKHGNTGVDCGTNRNYLS